MHLGIACQHAPAVSITASQTETAHRANAITVGPARSAPTLAGLPRMMHDGASAVEDRAARGEYPVDNIDVSPCHPRRPPSKSFAPPADVAKHIDAGGKIRTAANLPWDH